MYLEAYLQEISFIDMLRGEHIISKVYASCLVIFKKLATRSFWFKVFKDKNTLRTYT